MAWKTKTAASSGGAKSGAKRRRGGGNKPFWSQPGGATAAQRAQLRVAAAIGVMSAAGETICNVTGNVSVTDREQMYASADACNRTIADAFPMEAAMGGAHYANLLKTAQAARADALAMGIDNPMSDLLFDWATSEATISYMLKRAGLDMAGAAVNAVYGTVTGALGSMRELLGGDIGPTGGP